MTLHETIHNMNETIEYAAWCNMKTRCYNKNYTQYKDYGGRGIRACPQWLKSFATLRNQRYEIGHDAGLDVAAAIIRDSGK